MTKTVGYDVGGAHFKVAVAENGHVIAAVQIACPLWQGLDQLDAALSEASHLTPGAERHAVTMTGELCELFATRHDGVVTLTRYLAQRLGPKTLFYRGLAGFGDADAAVSQPELVGSTNFLATAQMIATRRPRSLLIDMGSTTTDIVACDRPQGLTDAERLQTGELVYTGLTRTPVSSVTTRAPLLGTWQGLARDAFATMADVRRVLGILPDDVGHHATTDGRGTSRIESLQRFARGFGRDGEERHLEGWKAAAAYIREQQLNSIYDGAIQALSRPGLDVSRGVVAAGIGADEADEIARRLGLPCTTFGALIDAAPELRLAATRYAPAVAVAMLAN
jgi:(4-(4-[2-(gamma-L-glutamylamino)ethyl]phenoxymethyl)furan-2-yl)methanamine synthase